MTTRSRRAFWVLAGLAIVVVGLVLGGTLLEKKDSPASQPRPATWSSVTPGPSVTRTPSTAPTSSAAPPPAAAKPPHYIFPVVGNVTYERTHHDYPASDIIAACGSTIRATTDGVILEVNRKDIWNARTDLGPDRGGLSVSLLGDDGVRYYGSHFGAINAGIKAGARVTAGQTLGQVGKTGDASVCHLHYGISPVCARTGDWWIRRGVIWPWSFLDSWRKGGNLSPVAAINAYSKAYGCPPLSGIPEP